MKNDHNTNGRHEFPFFNAGYDKPKYMLEARGVTLFEHSILSFKKYFSSERFLFIVKDIAGTKKFVNSKCIELGIKNTIFVS